MDDETRTWHQKFGVTLFNQCWELIERDRRGSDDDVEMFLLAAASGGTGRKWVVQRR